MYRSVLALFLLVNCIYLVNSATGNYELKDIDNTRAIRPLNIFQNLISMINNMFTSITNALKNVVNRVRNVIQTITGRTTTTSSTTSTTARGTSSTSTTTVASVAAKQSICMNELGEELPCSKVSVPYCWSKYPCDANVPGVTARTLYTYTTDVPDTYTDDTVYENGVATEGLCMDVNENWLPCSQVKESYCYYTHPC